MTTNGWHFSFRGTDYCYFESISHAVYTDGIMCPVALTDATLLPRDMPDWCKRMKFQASLDWYKANGSHLPDFGMLSQKKLQRQVTLVSAKVLGSLLACKHGYSELNPEEHFKLSQLKSGHFPGQPTPFNMNEVRNSINFHIFRRIHRFACRLWSHWKRKMARRSYKLRKRPSLLECRSARR